MPLLRATYDDEGPILGFLPEFTTGIFPIPAAVVLDETMAVNKRPEDLYFHALATLAETLP